MIDQGSSINNKKFQGKSKLIYKDWGFYICKWEEDQVKKMSYQGLLREENN